jgi:hypothetical protein
MMPTRQGSFRLFRFAGIEVFLHWSWLLVAVYQINTRAHEYPSFIWCALEYVSKDRKKALASIFRLVNAKDTVYRLKFKGLDPSLEYKITFEPGRYTTRMPGIELMQMGLEISLDSALTSRLILLTAED